MIPAILAVNQYSVFEYQKMSFGMDSSAISQPRSSLILARLIVQLAGLVLAGLVLLGTFNLVEAKPQFSAIAVDARTGKILFGSAIDGLRHPASLTKVMTLYLLFQDLKEERIKLTSEIGRASCRERV